MQQLTDQSNQFQWKARHWIAAGLLATFLVGGTALAYASSVAAPINNWVGAAPLPELLANRDAVVQGDTLYIVGGKNTSEKPSAEVYTAQVQEDGSLANWTSTTRLPTPVYLQATVATQSHIYVIGGWDGSQTRSEVWRAAFTSGGVGAWEKISNYPNALDLHAAVLINNRIYVVGGWSGTSGLRKVYYAEVQPSGLGEWTVAPDLPIKLFRHSVAAYNDVLYVTGGYDESDAHASVYYAKVNLDGSLSPWQQTTAMPNPRYYHATLVHDGRLVILGGKNDATEYNSVYAASINASGALGAWSAEPNLPESLYRFAAVTVEKFGSDFIYLAGGLHGVDYRQTVYHSAVPSLPTPTPTPTVGPTPTPTPSFNIRLENRPQQWVAPGEEIEYTITYQNNGVTNASDVKIRAVIPANAELVPNSIEARTGVTYTVTGAEPGAVIGWTLDSSANRENGTLVYRVRRLSFTSGIQRALSITNQGPANVTAGAPIVYQISVTNNVPISLTNLTIHNALPAGATYVSGGDGPPVNNIVKWTVANLRPDEVVTKVLTVTATRSLINSNYWATTAEGATTKGNALVITIVDEQPLPVAGDGVAIINSKAEISWQANGANYQAESNPTFNPLMPNYLPMIIK